ncbi:MAG: prepilin-type N-terminal cleavage/methylation domain-containing protein [Deltaproteobacteria bacterium]|nr:prepilin-type N-terminal cleavage/methylation domain-containing protein [Deltaproteobacteria bacterium]
MTERTCVVVRRRRGGRGFTMIEVMMAVVVFLTAAAGLLAFQEALMRSNASANDVTSATYVAEFWLERGRSESLLWNIDGTDLTPTRTPLLAPLGINVTTAGFATGWNALPMMGTRPAGAPLNRYLETWPGPAGQVRDYAEYCVQYRLTVLVPNEIVRLEVRVLWFKQGLRPAGSTASWTCPAAGMLVGADPDLRSVNVIQLASTIWRNQVVR